MNMNLVLVYFRAVFNPEKKGSELIINTELTINLK